MDCEYCRGTIHPDDSIIRIDNEEWHYDCFVKQVEENDEMLKEIIIDFFDDHVRENKNCFEACMEFFVDEHGAIAK